MRTGEKKVQENSDFSEENRGVQTSALSMKTVRKRNGNDAHATTERPSAAADRNHDSSGYLSLLFSSSNQPAAPASAPPRTLGGASKPRRKNSAKAGFVPALLARTWPRSKPISFCVKQLVPPRRQSAGDRFCLPVGHRTEWPLL